jgi:hypothetical protein
MNHLNPDVDHSLLSLMLPSDRMPLKMMGNNPAFVVIIRVVEGTQVYWA